MSRSEKNNAEQNALGFTKKKKTTKLHCKISNMSKTRESASSRIPDTEGYLYR